MTKLLWRITDDFEAEREGDFTHTRRLTTGPRGADLTLATPIVFQLLDDDGIVYYEGEAANEESLEYAYEFGIAGVGATSLRVAVEPADCWCCTRSASPHPLERPTRCYCTGILTARHWVTTLG